MDETKHVTILGSPLFSVESKLREAEFAGGEVEHGDQVRGGAVVRFKDKRAITEEEHGRIVTREQNPERRAFYQLAWHLGASQSDLAKLQAEDVDWDTHVISFFWMKTRWRSQQPPQIRFGKEVEEILAVLPKIGPLFPHLAKVRESDRATEFKQRCVGLNIHGITLHSYRYSWAERAKKAG